MAPAARKIWPSVAPPTLGRSPRPARRDAHPPVARRAVRRWRWSRTRQPRSRRFGQRDAQVARNLNDVGVDGIVASAARDPVAGRKYRERARRPASDDAGGGVAKRRRLIELRANRVDRFAHAVPARFLEDLPGLIGSCARLADQAVALPAAILLRSVPTLRTLARTSTKTHSGARLGGGTSKTSTRPSRKRSGDLFHVRSRVSMPGAESALTRRPCQGPLRWRSTVRRRSSPCRRNASSHIDSYIRTHRRKPRAGACIRSRSRR